MYRYCDKLVVYSVSGVGAFSQQVYIHEVEFEL